jgi:hypothetical protein
MQSVALLDCAGRRRSTGHARNLPPRASATQQGPSVPAGPTHRRGDHRRYALRGRRSRRANSCSTRCTGSLTTPPYHPHIQHAEIQTTQVYLHADLEIKERALGRATPIDSKPGRYRPPDQLLAFLESL